MFKLTNLSKNTLSLTEGRLAPGASAERAALGVKEEQYRDRNWLNITESSDESEFGIEPVKAAVEGTAPAGTESTEPTNADADKAEAKNTNTKKPVKSSAKED